MSWITEQVAEHTNGTIGALLNATFGNAPELLISVAALRSGFYRVVQLTMLGSMITNMIFVFGVACILGGLRWQVQELRLTSGNVSVGMLLVSTAGTLFPAILILSGHFPAPQGSTATALDVNRTVHSDKPSQEEITLSRVNAFVMMFLYLSYLLFQLGTHKEEFDDDEDSRREMARPNVFCRNLFSWMMQVVKKRADPIRTLIMVEKQGSLDRLALCNKKQRSARFTDNDVEDESDSGVANDLLEDITEGDIKEETALMDGIGSHRRKIVSTLNGCSAIPANKVLSPMHLQRIRLEPVKSKCSDAPDNRSIDEGDIDFPAIHMDGLYLKEKHRTRPLITLRVGLVWLFIITLCVSALSDILVETIDGFAERMHISEVFTSMVIVPFFSNVAEQVSAFIFAYRNEMDLCIGVTIGSAIQIATFVLPGSVLIGYMMDRSMTLYFHSYETACLFFCTVLVAAVLQAGSTNWFVGVMLVGVYIMFAAGIWFHEIENLSVDAEDRSFLWNETRIR